MNLIDYDVEPDPHPNTSSLLSAPPQQQRAWTSADAELERKIRAVPVLRDAWDEVKQLEREVASAKTAKATAARATVRARIAGRETTSDVLAEDDNITLLTALVAAARELLIPARYKAFGTLAAECEAKSEIEVARHITAKVRVDRMVKGVFEPGELPANHNAQEQSRVVFDAQREEQLAATMVGHFASEARQYRAEQAKIKRENPGLIAESEK